MDTSKQGIYFQQGKHPKHSLKLACVWVKENGLK